MSKTEIISVNTDQDIRTITELAKQIWEQHFTPIIGDQQVAYMLEHFQSFQAIQDQLQKGYEYYLLTYQGENAGYLGIHQEADALFLSKLYIHQAYRGRHISSEAMDFMKNLCRNSRLPYIYLTCNRNNQSTLNIYQHFGFKIAEAKVTDIGNNFVMDDYILKLTV